MTQRRKRSVGFLASVRFAPRPFTVHAVSPAPFNGEVIWGVDNDNVPNGGYLRNVPGFDHVRGHSPPTDWPMAHGR